MPIIDKLSSAVFGWQIASQLIKHLSRDRVALSIWLIHFRYIWDENVLFYVCSTKWKYSPGFDFIMLLFRVSCQWYRFLRKSLTRSLLRPSLIQTFTGMIILFLRNFLSWGFHALQSICDNNDALQKWRRGVANAPAPLTLWTYDRGRAGLGLATF